MATKKASPERPAQTLLNKKSSKGKSRTGVHANNFTTVGAFADSLVPVTYVLTKSNDLELKRLFIGDTKIELEVDQDPDDPNRFATRGTKQYLCINDDEGLKVILRADGKAGGSWSLEINRSGSPLNDNPIEDQVDNNGHADHNAFHV